MTYLLSLSENAELTIGLIGIFALTATIVVALEEMDWANLFGWAVFLLLVLSLIMVKR